jgi:hypothetical protein
MSNVSQSTLAVLSSEMDHLRKELAAMASSEFEKYMYAIYHSVEAADYNAKSHGRTNWNTFDRVIAENEMIVLWPRKDQPTPLQLR